MVPSVDFCSDVGCGGAADVGSGNLCAADRFPACNFTRVDSKEITCSC